MPVLVGPNALSHFAASRDDMSPYVILLSCFVLSFWPSCRHAPCTISRHEGCAGGRTESCIEAGFRLILRPSTTKNEHRLAAWRRVCSYDHPCSYRVGLDAALAHPSADYLGKAQFDRLHIKADSAGA